MSCDVGEVTERLENELFYRDSTPFDFGQLLYQQLLCWIRSPKNGTMGALDKAQCDGELIKNLISWKFDVKGINPGL